MADIIIKKTMHMHFAHRNNSFHEKHQCKRIHGHTSNIAAYIKTQWNPVTGISTDFSILKNALKAIADQFEHCWVIWENDPIAKHLQTLDISKTGDFLADFGASLCTVEWIPSAENFCIHFYEQLQNTGLNVVRVEFQETPTNTAIYEGK